MALPGIPSPAAPLYRVGRALSPFGLRPWADADADGTFGNRFDDPGRADGIPQEYLFRVVYCAGERACAFGETTARFRPNLRALAGIGAVEDEGQPDPVALRPGLVTLEWQRRRQVGTIMLDPSLRFVDLADGETLAALRPVFAPLAARLGFSDFDLSAVTSARRILTQRIARHIYEQTTEEGQAMFAGIRYPSRLNGNWNCWAVFDGFLRGTFGIPETIFPDDPGLRAAANLFRLPVESVDGSIIAPP